MLKSLEVQNFQSHRESKLDFHEGLNIIIGSNDKGKTAIIRALRLLVENKPRGSSYISWFAGKESCKIKATFDDGTITRERNKTKTKNQYQINNGEPLKALTDMPKEVTDFLRMSEINIQGQHSPYFLLDQTAGQVSKQMNKVANLDIMGECLTTINSMINTEEIGCKTKTGEIKHLKDDLSDLQWVNDADTQLIEIESIQVKMSLIEGQSTLLAELINSIETINEDLDELETWMQLKEPYEIVVDLFNKIRKLDNNISVLGPLLIESTKMNNQIETNKKYKEKSVDVKELEKMAALIKTLKKQEGGISTLVEDFKSGTITAGKLEYNIDNLKTKRKEILSKLDICPTCDTILKNKKRKL